MSRVYILGTGNQVSKDATGDVFIVGDSNTVAPDASGNVILINCEGYEADVTDSGYTIINNDVKVSPLSILSGASIRMKTVLKTADFIAGNSEYNIYGVDATAGNIDVTLTSDVTPVWFVRIDGTANTVTITPTSGTINGAASYPLNIQYEKIHVVLIDSNYYA